MKHILSIIFLSVIINSHCQTRFNKTYSVNYTPGLRNITEYNDSSYIGLGFDRYQSKLNILIIKLGLNGDTLWTKHYGDTIYDYYHGLRNCLKSNNYGYSIAGSRHDTTNISSMLMKFDSNFDTLWTQYYFNNTNFTVFYNHIQTEDKGFALVGVTDESDPDGDVLLVKTDSLGNMQWYKKYGTPAYDFGISIIRTYDEGYLIGGFSEGNGDGGEGYLIKTDSLGNLEWTQYYGNPLYADGSIYSILKTIDNKYIFSLSTYAVDPVSQTVSYYKYSLIKLDTNFSIIWQKNYGIPSIYTGMGSISEASNGDILGTISNNNLIGLYRFSADGDSIWKRYYSPPSSTTKNILYTVQQTKDNGFIMAGVVYNNAPQQIWVVKVDSCGCDTAGCNCNNNFISKTNDINELLLYPNPANNKLFININNEKKIKTNRLQIFDLYGREIKNLKITGNKYCLNISGLNKGMYLIKIGDKVKRFIKE